MDKLKLKDALRIQEKSFEEAIKLLYGIDINTIPLSELHNYTIPKKEKETQITDFVTIKGTTYKVVKDMQQITYSQFVDFQQYAKTKDVVGMCSCFLIPKEGGYNDGSYSLEELKEGLLEADYYVVTDYCFFFKQLYELFVSVFLTYSTQTLKKYKKNTDTNNTEQEQIMHSWALLLHTCKRLSRLSMKP